MSDPHASEDVERNGGSLKMALEHGFTERQWRAAKAIEFRIFGYQWHDQGDRAAAMYVAILEALREEAKAALPSLAEIRERALREAAEIAREASMVDAGMPSDQITRASRAGSIYAAILALIPKGDGR
jgi:hypothetical protein